MLTIEQQLQEESNLAIERFNRNLQLVEQVAELKKELHDLRFNASQMRVSFLAIKEAMTELQSYVHREVCARPPHNGAHIALCRHALQILREITI